MLKICLLYCLCLASGQFLFGTNVDVSSYGGYTFEYHIYSIELLGFIRSDEHVTRTSFVQADITHRDIAATSACVGMDLYEMKYPADGAANKQGKTTAETTTKS